MLTNHRVKDVEASRGFLGLWLLAALVLSVGCGAGARGARPAYSVAHGTSAPSAPPLPLLPGEAAAPTPRQEVSEEIYATQVTYELGPTRYDAEAPAPPPPPPPPERAPDLPPKAKVETSAAAEPAKDARASTQGPLLVYRASFLLSVYELDKTQATLTQAVEGLGGYVAAQTDTQLTLRVPAPKFQQALRAVEGAGKVRARNVQASDVGDQYRDLELRLRTAELLRARLEAMMARTEKVPEALAVQTELERIVREIEQLKGELRGLSDRIAYSTLVVEFRAESRPDLDDGNVFRLPFAWLDELGLHHLLELSP
jgi:hypothetical protein